MSPTDPQCVASQSAGCFDHSPYYRSVNGTADPYSPRWTGNVGVQYSFPLPGAATLTPRLDFSYPSMQWATIFQNPVDAFQSRQVLDFALTYARQLTAYGTNVTNDYYITGQTGNANFWSAPAEYGLRIQKSF